MRALWRLTVWKPLYLPQKRGRDTTVSLTGSRRWHRVPIMEWELFHLRILIASFFAISLFLQVPTRLEGGINVVFNKFLIQLMYFV